jgi:hypothetical protein
MERFGAKEYNYDWGRHGGWIEFRIDCELYRFEHSVEKGKAHGQKLVYGSDAFAQLVLALEDLARLAERGIYNLKRWIEGMKFLPPPVTIPVFFIELGFHSIPASIAEVTDRYKTLAKQAHPDTGGSNEAFIALQRATEDAKRYLEGK